MSSDSPVTAIMRNVSPVGAALFPESQPKMKTPPVPPPPPVPEITPEMDPGNVVAKKRRERAAVQALQSGSGGTILSNATKLGG